MQSNVVHSYPLSDLILFIISHLQYIYVHVPVDMGRQELVRHLQWKVTDQQNIYGGKTILWLVLFQEHQHICLRSWSQW